VAVITLLANGSRSTALLLNDAVQFVTQIDGRPVLPDVWNVYVGVTLVFSGLGSAIAFTPTLSQPHTIHVIAQDPEGFQVEGVFVYSVSGRPAGVASIFIRWDREVYRERDTLIGTISWNDPQGLPARINSWTLCWNNQVMRTGTGSAVYYEGLYHGLWRLRVTGVDAYGVPLAGDGTAFVQPYYERRDATVPPVLDGSLVYLGSVFSGIVHGEGGVSATLPYQLASYAQDAKLMPGTTHVFFDLDPSFDTVDDEVVIRSHTGNYALMGLLAPGAPIGYDVLPNDYLPAGADKQMRYTIDVFNTSGAFYSAMNFRVRVRCYRLVPALYRYSQCPYSTQPGGEGQRQRRWAVVFSQIQLQGGQVYNAQAPGTIPLATLTATGLPNPYDSLTRVVYTQSNRYVAYERSEAPDLDANAICAIEGLRPFCMAVQVPGNLPAFTTLGRVAGKMYLYLNGAAITQGATVRVRIQGGSGETVYTVPITADVYNPSSDAFVCVGGVDVSVQDYQFDFNGLVAWIEMDETTAVQMPPGTVPTPVWGPDYVYSGTYFGTVARGVSFDGACYSNPVKMVAVDVESASVVQQISGCTDPACGPTAVYCYISVCAPSECVTVTQPLHNPAPYVAYGSNPSRCYASPEFIAEGSTSGDFIAVSGDLCGDAYRYTRCDLKDTAVVVYPCLTVPHSYVRYLADCYALSGAIVDYGTIATIVPVGSVAPVAGCLDVLCTGSNANGDAYVYFDTQTDDKIPVYFEGLTSGLPTFGVAPGKTDLGSTLTDGVAALKFAFGPRLDILTVSSTGVLVVDVGLPSVNKRIIVRRSMGELVYDLPIHTTSKAIAVQPNDRLLLDISAYGSFTKRQRGMSTVVRWTPLIDVPRVFDTSYVTVSGTYAINAVGFTGVTDRTSYQFFGTLPSDTTSSVVNPDSLVTIQGVDVPTAEFALVRSRSVGEPPPGMPSGIQWYGGQTFTGQVQFNFYALRGKQGSHGEMDVWFGTAGDFPTYLLAQPYRALVRDTRSYRCDASMLLATRNAFAAATGLGGAQLPNVYAEPVTGQVVSSKASSFAIRKGATTLYRIRQDTGIARHVEATADTEIVWAHISDYGFDYPQRTDISNLVHSFNPDFIVGAGDNWQSGGTNSLVSLDNKTGAYYHDFIFPYIGAYGAGATEQRFLVVPGNHDHTPPGGGPIVPGTYRLPMFLSYFQTQQNFEAVKWPVHFFLIDNTDYMWDGDATATGRTALWLKARLAASTAPWKVVVLHYPPWCSGTGHINYTTRRWPFKAWGADILFSGHVHVYERFMHADGLVSIVCGSCNPAYWTQFNPALIWQGSPITGSTFGYGVAPQLKATSRMRATSHALTVDYIDTGLTVIDSVTLTK